MSRGIVRWVSALGLVAAAGCASPDIGTAGTDEGGDAERTASTTAALAACDAASIRAATPASRKNIIDRALRWADPHSPEHDKTWYSQTNYFEGYRMDCSGFVSMCWHLPTSRTTFDFSPHDDDISHRTSWEDLEPGDALNRWDEHIMLFAGWLDEKNGDFCAIEEYETGTLATIQAHNRNDKWITSGFVPIRYNDAGKVPSSGGGATGGGNTGGVDADQGCHSGTLGRNVAENACVQSKADKQWYQCSAGSWVARWEDKAACSASFPL